MSTKQTNVISDTIELVLFKINHLTCGIQISDIQEIKKLEHITQVYNAPDYVKGVIQLRGQIVTLIDTSKKLGFEEVNIVPTTRIVVIKQGDEYIGFLVDEVEDSIKADKNFIERPPANMDSLQNQLFRGILKQNEKLICILDVDKVLQNKETLEDSVKETHAH